jgi:hypothetical protein
VGSWRLTVRHGPEVGHEKFDDLAEAVEGMRQRALAIRSEGPLRPVAAIRDFDPREQVKARLELSGSGWLRKQVAGIDVRGNGEFVPYRGRLRREEMDPSGHDTPFDLVRETLERDERR